MQEPTNYCLRPRRCRAAEAKVRDLLDAYHARAQVLYNIHTRKAWAYSTNITDHNSKEAVSRRRWSGLRLQQQPDAGLCNLSRWRKPYFVDAHLRDVCVYGAMSFVIGMTFRKILLNIGNQSNNTLLRTNSFLCNGLCKWTSEVEAKQHDGSAFHMLGCQLHMAAGYGRPILDMQYTLWWHLPIYCTYSKYDANITRSTSFCCINIVPIYIVISILQSTCGCRQTRINLRQT